MVDYMVHCIGTQNWAFKARPSEVSIRSLDGKRGIDIHVHAPDDSVLKRKMYGDGELLVVEGSVTYVHPIVTEWIKGALRGGQTRFWSLQPAIDTLYLSQISLSFAQAINPRCVFSFAEGVTTPVQINAIVGEARAAVGQAYTISDARYWSLSGGKILTRLLDIKKAQRGEVEDMKERIELMGRDISHMNTIIGRYKRLFPNRNQMLVPKLKLEYDFAISD